MRLDVRVDLADLVRRARRQVRARAVVVDEPAAARLRRAGAAGEVVAFVDGDREQRVLLS